MSYQFYKLMHFLGIFLLLISLGGVAFAAATESLRKNAMRKIAAISHGVSLLLVLVGGFGMLARLGLVSGLPGWIYAKLIIWVLLGAALFIAKRGPALGAVVFCSSGFLALLAGYFAIYKSV